MKLKSILAAVAAGVALASPLAASAYTYNDGTYKWGFATHENENNERVATLYRVRRVDGQKISGAIAFPATVSLTVTNELGWSKWDEATEKYTWQSTRAQKIETLTLPVEEISWDGFLYMYKDEEWNEEWEDDQSDPLITSVTIPEGVKYVYGLVGECLTNVTAVSFPSTVKSINSCFGYCDKLASVSVPEDAYIDSAFIGTPWAQSMGDFFIWNGNLIRYQGTASEVVVPEGVETLGTAAFAPYYWEGWTEESREMFAAATNITSVTLPASLEEIGSSAFSDCGKLASVIIPNRVSSIGYNAFSYCENLASVTLPASLEYIESYAFGGCEKLTSINIPDNVYYIGYEAFYRTALTAITLPQELKYLGGYVFAYTAISSLTIPDGVKDLNSTCEHMTNLTSVTLPSRAKSMRSTFNGCSKLAAIDIPASVEEIGYNTFNDCRALASVTGGAGLKYVDSDAFGEDGYYDEEKKEWIEVGKGVPFYDNASNGIRTLGPVAYGYKGNLPANLVIPGNVKYVMTYWTDPNNEGDVKTLTLSDGVEVLGSGAFDEYYNLETVNLGNTVTNLSGAFRNNSNLATVTGGAALESGVSAFYGTKYQQDLAAFAGNDDPFELIRLGKVVLGYKGKFAVGAFAIPDDVTEFGMYGWDVSTTNVTALTGGAALTQFAYLSRFEKLQRIELTGELMSFSCSNTEVTDVNLPNAKLRWVESDTFWGSTNLVNVTMGVDPDGLREAMMDGEGGISSAAFMQCDKLQSVNFVFKGYKVKGFEARFETGWETFPNELSTFKYIGVRNDFSEPRENGYVDWNSFNLYPTLVKVVVDESALEPFDKDVKSAYVGMLYDADYNLVGTFEVTVQKATAKKDATATVKITPLNGKKESVKGSVDANGNGQGALAGLVFGANGVTGTLTAPKNNATFKLEGTSDATKSKDKADKDYLKRLKGKTWGVVLSPNGNVQSDFANGYIALSLTMNNTGKAKVVGTLPDGNKVSVSTKIIVGADTCAIPVVFSKSGESLGFILWTDLEGKAKDVTDVSDWDGKVQKVTFVQGEGAHDYGDALQPLSVPVFRLVDDLPVAFTNSIVDFRPRKVEFSFKNDNATMWDFAKAPTIKAKNGVIDWAKIEADYAQGKTNFSGLKLKVNKKTGVITGSFTLYSFNDKNALKKTKVTVNGVMVNGVGYGVGFVKKIGACFVEVW